MREIKFRAWDSLNNIMLSWEKFKNIKFDIGDGYEVGIPLDILDEKYQKQHRLKPLQFTGIKDKNGKEIYEGDIVKWKINFSSGKDVIVFRDGRFELSDSYIIDSGYRSVDNINTHGEIIGNIFENPELINQP